ncbi:lysylphosphatidylglycerol synthase transmembrane domain-containing protein [Halomonas sp. I1]|nr:lysylphosphatidylglycerol synthase transmembrane domain-containing protein [Halomonas sp. I1]MDT8893250.1 lysylphosphatidylglycerol synthase transmembrane domain-containing protein [Halomonas sp. I1]
MIRGLSWAALGARWAIVLAAVALVYHLVDGDRVGVRFEDVQFAWVAAGLAISVPQVAMSAWRWWYTLRCLGLRMGGWQALQEYYLASFLNQILPGGMAGDATRAWRHARQAGPAWGDRRRQQALRAVFIERVSGQVALAMLVVASLGLLPSWQPWRSQLAISAGGLGWAAVVACAVVGGGLLVWRSGAGLRRERPWPAIVAGAWQDLRRSLLTPRPLSLHLLVSSATVLSYGLVMVCAARAIGIATPTSTLLALAPLLLLAMVMPLSLAGWGWREGAAALVWPLVGLSSADGVAVSLAYGLLVLLSSLPGALVLLVVVMTPRTDRSSGTGSPAFSSFSAKREVEEGVGPQRKAAAGRTSRVAQGIDGRQVQAGLARADQQGGDEQVQAVQAIRRQKVRQGGTAALDQDASKSRLAQPDDDRPGQGAIGSDGQLLSLQVCRMPVCRTAIGESAGRHQVKGSGLAIGEQTMMLGEPPLGVDHHAQRMGARDMPHGQRRVVRGDGTGADHHGVGQGPQPMQMRARCDAVDVVGMPGPGRDASIQALSQLADDAARRGTQDGQQGIEQVGTVGIEFGVGAPGRIARHRQAARGEIHGQGARRPVVITRAQQGLPAGVDTGRGTGHQGSFRGGRTIMRGSPAKGNRASTTARG